MNSFIEGDYGDSYDQASTARVSLCGKKNPFYFTSTKKRIWVRFKSSFNFDHRGFVAGYVMYDPTESKYSVLKLITVQQHIS